MATVQLRNLSALQRALRTLGSRGEDAMVQAMRNTARYGVAAVVRTSATTKPRPKASGDYERSWLVVKIKDGATVSNSARHAIFVEVGRKPGRRPPRDAIIEWLLQKRIGSRSKISKLRKKGGRTILASTRGAMKERARVRFLALKIASRIGRLGIAGRWILFRTMPKIAKRARHEIRKAIRSLTKNPPR